MSQTVLRSRYPICIVSSLHESQKEPALVFSLISRPYVEEEKINKKKTNDGLFTSESIKHT